MMDDWRRPRLLVSKGCSGSTWLQSVARSLLSRHGVLHYVAVDPKDKAAMREAAEALGLWDAKRRTNLLADLVDADNKKGSGRPALAPLQCAVT